MNRLGHRLGWFAACLAAPCGCSDYFDGDLVVDELRVHQAGEQLEIEVDVRNTGRSSVWVQASQPRILHELDDGQFVLTLTPDEPGAHVAGIATILVEYRRLRSIGDVFGLDRTTITLDLLALAVGADGSGVQPFDVDAAEDILVEVAWYGSEPPAQGLEAAPPPDGVALGAR